MEKEIWIIDEDGFLISKSTLNKNEDYREGNWIIPANAVEKKAPKEKDGHLLHWNGDKWDYAKVELAEDDEMEMPEITQTSEMLLMRLNNEFSVEKAELNAAFVSAQMKNNASLQLELREELAELEKDYETN